MTCIQYCPQCGQKVSHRTVAGEQAPPQERRCSVCHQAPRYKAEFPHGLTHEYTVCKVCLNRAERMAKPYRDALRSYDLPPRVKLTVLRNATVEERGWYVGQFQDSLIEILALSDTGQEALQSVIGLGDHILLGMRNLGKKGLEEFRRKTG
jgi:hypothetical protein